MKAVVYERYGPPDVLHIKEVDKPIPKNNEVLIKIHATTVTKYDTWLRSSTAPTGFWLPSRIDSGIREPKQPILGTELAGQIEAVGKDVTQLKQGDAVFGFSEKMGTYTEYICLPEEVVALKPANATYSEAATVLYGALTALYFLRKANIQNGQKILIYGASGGVGGYAVQLAKYFGAEVTGVCSTAKLHIVRSLGADHVIDYTKEDFTQTNQTYDVIVDTIGKTSVFRTGRLLNKTGYYIFATFGLPLLVQILWLSLTSKKKVIFGILKATHEDMVFLRELMEAGELRSVIDRCYPLEQVAEAHRYVESGHKRGHVVIRVVSDDEKRAGTQPADVLQKMGEIV